MAMKATELGLTDEVFTHISDEDGRQTTYAVTALIKRCQQGDIPKAKVPVEAAHAQYCVERRGVEKERLQALFAHPAWLTQPMLFIEMPDGSHLLVDGTHRYTLAFAVGVPELIAYMIPWSVAKEFIVEDAPQTTEDDLMQHSHLTLLRKLFGEGS
jgi:hypothetical protein